MYKFLFLALALSLIFACEKASSNDDVTPVSTDVVLSSGTFKNGVHTTSGSVKLIKDKDGNKFLLFENFYVDKGPDLHIYLSTNLTGTDYTDVTKTVTNGNVRLAVPTGAKDTQKFVLIWCKAAAVLFGSAELKRQW